MAGVYFGFSPAFPHRGPRLKANGSGNGYTSGYGPHPEEPSRLPDVERMIYDWRKVAYKDEHGDEYLCILVEADDVEDKPQDTLPNFDDYEIAPAKYDTKNRIDFFTKAEMLRALESHVAAIQSAMQLYEIEMNSVNVKGIAPGLDVPARPPQTLQVQGAVFGQVFGKAEPGDNPLRADDNPIDADGAEVNATPVKAGNPNTTLTDTGVRAVDEALFEEEQHPPLQRTPTPNPEAEPGKAAAKEAGGEGEEEGEGEGEGAGAGPGEEREEEEVFG